MPMKIHSKLQRSVKSQVLPQFRGTKLGKLRMGPDAGERLDVHYNWKIILLYIGVNLIFLGMTIVCFMWIKTVQPGWVLLGIWVLLTICGLLCVIFICIRSRMCCVKPNDTENIEMIRIGSLENLHKFPWDPVMHRAIVNLVYHGQDDCEECRLLRHREDHRPFQRITNWKTEGRSYDCINSSSCNTNHGFSQSPAQRNKFREESGNWIHSKGGPSIEVQAIVEDTCEEKNDYFVIDEYDITNECYYDYNSSNNNNRIMKSDEASTNRRGHGALRNFRNEIPPGEHSPILASSKMKPKFYNSTNTDLNGHILSHDSFTLHGNLTKPQSVRSQYQNPTTSMTPQTETSDVTNKKHISGNSRKPFENQQTEHNVTSHKQNNDVTNYQHGDVTKNRRRTTRKRKDTNSRERYIKHGLRRKRSSRLSRKKLIKREDAKEMSAPRLPDQNLVTAEALAQVHGSGDTGQPEQSLRDLINLHSSSADSKTNTG